MIKDEFKSKLFDVLKTFHETMLRHRLSKWETDMPGRYMYSLFFSHTFVEKIEKSIHMLPVYKLYPTLLALLSHTASSVANEG